VRLIYNGHMHDFISPRRHDPHWLRVPERIKFRQAVLVSKCRNRTSPAHLTRDVQRVSDDDSRRRLRSSSSNKMTACRSRLTTPDDRAFSGGMTYRPLLPLHRPYQFSRNALKHICLTRKNFVERIPPPRLALPPVE